MKVNEREREKKTSGDVKWSTVFDSSSCMYTYMDRKKTAEGEERIRETHCAAATAS